MTTLIDDTCKYPHIRLMSEGTYYQQHEGEQRCIPIEEYSQHLKNEILLDILMKAGIHNFEGFEQAMLDYQEALK